MRSTKPDLGGYSILTAIVGGLLLFVWIFLID
jgi:hypothetical protein